MIQITPQTRILVAVEAVDFRNGIDGLARVCQEQLQADPFSGRLFVFRSRRGTAIRILVYDGQGFWLAQKRLSKGRFRWWPEGRSPHEVARSLAAHLGVGFVSLTEALDLDHAGRSRDGWPFSCVRGLCGGRAYAKPQRRRGGAACMSAMWDSALSRSEQRGNQRIGCLESASTQAKRQYGLHDLQLLRWIYPQVDLSCAGISVAEPQCHLANVPCGPEYGEGAAMPELMGRHGAFTQR